MSISFDPINFFLKIFPEDIILNMAQIYGQNAKVAAQHAQVWFCQVDLEPPLL